MIYVTINGTTTDYNVSGTSFTFENDNNVSCSLSFQVAAVNPAGEGEHSQLQIIDCEFTFKPDGQLKMICMVSNVHT